MAAIARFWSHAKTDNANRLADPENLYIPGFKEIIKKKKLCRKKTNYRQVAAILIIGGKLKILSGDLHTHG